MEQQIHRRRHQCFEDPERRAWRTLLGDLLPKLTLATDPGGTPHALILKAEALAALEQAGVETAGLKNTIDGAPDRQPAGHGGSGLDRGAPSAPTDPSAMRAAAQLRRTTVSNILAAVTVAAESRPDEDATFARLIFDCMAGGGYHDAINDTVKRRCLPRGKDETQGAVLAAHAEQLDARGMRALILELALARGAYFTYATAYPERLVAAAAAYDIDIAAIETSTADELAGSTSKRSSRKSTKTAAT